MKHVLQDLNPVIRQPITVLSASGITGVWAEQNTREAIFAALQRREVFATSGTRMQVRMFAGWKYPRGPVAPFRLGAARPMLAACPWAATWRAHRRRARAALHRAGAEGSEWRQPGSHPDHQGVAQGRHDHEKVFDVVWSGNRKPDAKTGKVPAVGNTVDLGKATYTNTIGAPQLSAQWSDPDFDATAPAAYYARVIEIPTPRWSTYLAVRNNLPLTTAQPATLQERAWTSPIFYTP